MGMYPLLVLAVVMLVLVGALALYKEFFGGGAEVEESPYVKKPFVFDHSSELTLYRQLVELFGDRYYIFPQVPYSRLVEVKKGEDKRHRNRFDKKIADFVLCDKERAVAQLVIELDGSSHKREKTKVRDALVDRMLTSIGLPILHLPVGASSEEVRGGVERALL
jgi:Protein of unknown function (DUF2726)